MSASNVHQSEAPMSETISSFFSKLAHDILPQPVPTPTPSPMNSSPSLQHKGLQPPSVSPGRTGAKLDKFEFQWKQHNRDKKISDGLKEARLQPLAAPLSQDAHKRRSHGPRKSEEFEKDIDDMESIGDPAPVEKIPSDPHIYREIRKRPSNIHPRQPKFEKLLSDPIVNLQDLQKLCWNGVADSCRDICWKLLLGYLPTVKERRDSTLDEKRKKYWESVKQICDVDDSDRADFEKQIYHQIAIDVPRTNPKVPLFQIAEIQERLLRILYVWAIRHPASGYVQGINDLVTPFFSVFLQPHLADDVEDVDDLSQVPSSVLDDVEADTYWCVTKFIDSIQDNFTFAQPGIQRMIYKLKELMKKIDNPLHAHLEAERVEYIQFAFRWMNCLLMRELPLRVVFRTWDTYLSESESFASLHVYVCAAFLTNWSVELKGKEFQELMTFLQHFPTEEWMYLLPFSSEAFVWMSLYNDTGHLS